MYMCIYIHTYIHTYIHIHALMSYQYTYTYSTYMFYACMHTYMHTYIHACIHTCKQWSCMYVYSYTIQYVHVCIVTCWACCVCMVYWFHMHMKCMNDGIHLHTYMCSYIHTYIHTCIYSCHMYVYTYSIQYVHVLYGNLVYMLYVYGVQVQYAYAVYSVIFFDPSCWYFNKPLLKHNSVHTTSLRSRHACTTWITVVILELIHAQRLDSRRAVFIRFKADLVLVIHNNLSNHMPLRWWWFIQISALSTFDSSKV